VPGPCGAPPGSVRTSTGAPSTVAPTTDRALPVAAVNGLFGQARKTTSHTRAPGVNDTRSVPVALARSSATSKASSTTGRSGGGSGQVGPEGDGGAVVVVGLHAA